MRLTLSLVTAAALVACSPKPAPAAASSSVPVLPTPIAGAPCHARGGLQDPICTPGAIDPAVTQSNIASTICRSGYSKSVRPPESTTSRIKHERLRAYGLPNTTEEMRQVELDHLVSIELGGAPADLANLWPEPWNDSSTGPGAHTKDVLEDELHKRVCAGQMPLAEAQQAIAFDWYAEYQALGLHGRSGTVVE